jgi:hypothetical protein
MKNVLLVPVHLDALPLGRDELVLEAMADFSRLPYADGARDVNPDTANVSEAIVPQDFQDENLNLRAGIHLHWALPDALTRGAQGDSGTDFPLVPNRWLLVRSRAGEGGARVVEKKWVVESDYLYPEGAGARAAGVSVPHRPDEGRGERCPFRLMGRKMPLEAWRARDDGAEYTDALTAVGYGEPSFAAFYPNCHSVFGFHDDDYAGAPPAGLRYDLVGWYADPDKDHLKTFVAGFRRRFVADFVEQKRQSGEEVPELVPGPTAGQIKEAVEGSLGWTVGLAEGESFPEQLLCYARLTFAPGAPSGEPADGGVCTGIAVANTSTEALSAYLAQAVDAERKAEVEDQLEAVLLSSRLENRQLDVGPKFEEARHEKGFAAVAGGALWSVTLENRGASPADAARADAQSQITLPAQMAHSLNALNARQQAFDRAQQELESMRRQLFSDWYKYMLSAYPPEESRDDYPDGDEVRNFVELKVLAPLASKEAETGALWLTADEAGGVTGASARDSRPDSLAALLAADIGALASAIADHNKAIADPNNSPEVAQSHAAFALRQIPAPRYYRPTDPVVLVVGPAAKPSERHGQDGRLRDDGLLECQTFQSSETQPLLPDQLAQLSARVEELAPGEGVESVAFRLWKERPWNPFLLEWEAEVFPVESGSNLDPDTGHYGAGYITDNYALAENGVDLSARPGRGFVTKAASVYSGRSILTPHAVTQLKGQLEAYLREQLLGDYLKDQGLPTPDSPADYFRENRAAVLGWYKQKNCGAAEPTPTCQLVRAYELLDAPDFYALSQSLGGFNEALLMRRRTMQLEIADPLGFDDQRPFTEAVRAAVAAANTVAPLPLNDFLPVRAGALKLLRLRLVDTFGRVKELDCRQVVTTEKLKDEDSPYPVTLPPRLAQAARLNFRWLSAEGDEQEVNDHPATTPVCGWLLPNNLDNSLMVYDGAGRALGAVNQQAEWQPAPGAEEPVGVGEIGNRHLRKVVAYLVARGRAFVQDFLSALAGALENIEPENFAQHQDLALLMGRPLALVRASLNLELQGAPATHQGWNHFRQDMRRYRRDDTGFTHVRFPVRLGEYRQMNDGLAGYWVEDGDGYEGDIFYAPQGEKIADDLIETHADGPLSVYQTVAAPPHLLSMLVDPRGSVHAASGIAPVKAIQIPPDQYTDALRAIEVTFLSSPVLTDLGVVRLPLPPEPGFNWSWLQRGEGGVWAEVSTAGAIRKQTVLDAFGREGEAVWAVLKEKGWIAETGEATASVTAKDLRGQKTLGDTWAEKEPAIELLLAASRIGQVNTQATFSGRQSVIEGWLKLTSAADAPASK